MLGVVSANINFSVSSTVGVFHKMEGCFSRVGTWPCVGEDATEDLDGLAQSHFLCGGYIDDV